MAKCKGKTTDGGRCKRNATVEQWCRQHYNGGAADGVLVPRKKALGKALKNVQAGIDAIAARPATGPDALMRIRHIALGVGLGIDTAEVGMAAIQRVLTGAV